jgi:hypothetical protein
MTIFRCLACLIKKQIKASVAGFFHFKQARKAEGNRGSIINRLFVTGVKCLWLDLLTRADYNSAAKLHKSVGALYFDPLRRRAAIFNAHVSDSHQCLSCSLPLSLLCRSAHNIPTRPCGHYKNRSDNKSRAIITMSNWSGSDANGNSVSFRLTSAPSARALAQPPADRPSVRRWAGYGGTEGVCVCERPAQA